MATEGIIACRQPDTRNDQSTKTIFGAGNQETIFESGYQNTDRISKFQALRSFSGLDLQYFLVSHNFEYTTMFSTNFLHTDCSGNL